MKLQSRWVYSTICGLLLIALTLTVAQAQGPLLPKPESMTVDRSLSPADAAQMIQTARLFYAFWDTGNANYASAAVDNDFRDLNDVSLVDLDVIRFLATCQTEGISLVHCSRYINNWITKERFRLQQSSRRTHLAIKRIEMNGFGCDILTTLRVDVATLARN